MKLTITLEESSTNQAAIVKNLDKLLRNLKHGYGAVELKNDADQTTFLLEYDALRRHYHLVKNFTATRF